MSDTGRNTTLRGKGTAIPFDICMTPHDSHDDTCRNSGRAARAGAFCSTQHLEVHAKGRQGPTAVLIDHCVVCVCGKPGRECRHCRWPLNRMLATGQHVHILASHTAPGPALKHTHTYAHSDTRAHTSEPHGSRTRAQTPHPHPASPLPPLGSGFTHRARSTSLSWRIAAAPACMPGRP